MSFKKFGKQWDLNKLPHEYGSPCSCRSCHMQSYHFWFGVSEMEEPRIDCRFNYLRDLLGVPIVKWELNELDDGKKVFIHIFKDPEIQKLVYKTEEPYIAYEENGISDAEEVEDEDLKECILIEEDTL